MASVVGVGLFGLPYFASKSGFVPFLVAIVALTPVVIAIHLRLADVVAGTPQRERIPGYVRIYLGRRWERLSIVISLLGLLGAQLAYLTVGGRFLQLLLQPVLAISPVAATLLFFALGSLALLRGTRSVALTDVVLRIMFLLLLAVLHFFALPHYATKNIVSSVWENTPLVYGILIFSLWGLSLIPETVELAAKQRRVFRRVIIFGVCTAALLSILFTLMIVLVTGTHTSTDALSGFIFVVGTQLSWVAGFFGFLAVFTAYISMGLTLRQSIQLDIHVPKKTALAITLVVPTLIALLLTEQFLTVIGLTGGLLLGTEGILVLLTARAFAKRHHQKKSWVAIPLISILALGIVYELVASVSKLAGR